MDKWSMNTLLCDLAAKLFAISYVCRVATHILVMTIYECMELLGQLASITKVKNV